MSKVAKNTIFGQDARDKLKAGIDVLANAVGATLGPKGRNAIFEREFQIPVVSNDGVSIAREITLADRFENMGVELLREAAIKTNDVAGDGTTSSTVIAHELITQGFELIKTGTNPMDLKRKLEKNLKELLEELKAFKIEIDGDEMLTQVATISANNDREIGEAIMKAVKEVGKDGVITVEEKYGVGVELEMQKGFQINTGIIHPWMVTDTQRVEAVLKDVPVLCVASRLTSVDDISPLFTTLQRNNLKQCVLVAPEIGQDALAIILEARKSGDFHIVGIKAPFVGERQADYLEDIAIYTGGEVMLASKPMKELTVGHFGTAKRVISSRKTTTFIDGEGSPEKIAERVASITTQFEQVDTEFDKEKLKERVAKLTGGVAVLKVGAMTEPEMKEKKYRIEDAINATQAAMAEGVVIGGGMTYLRMCRNDYSEMVNSALSSIFKRICENAGVNPDAKTTEIFVEGLDKNLGYNALTDEVEDLLVAGVLDPYKVVRSALENAFSVAMMMLTSESLTTFAEDPAKARII